ncbi:MAG: radical SAM protein [Myxococcota bacterium]|nr:radical SAM protein [Myxococcota bacterium]
MKALLLNVGHGDLTGDEHPRHNVAPMDLAQCAAILEEAGWEVDLWDTILTPTATNQEIDGRANGFGPDLVVVRPLVHTGDTTAELCRSLTERGALCLAMGPSGPHMGRTLLTPIEGVMPVQGVLVGEPERTLMDLLPFLKEKSLPEEPMAGLQTDPETPAHPRAFLKDLDDLPIPAQHLLMKQGYRFRYPLDVKGPLRIGYVLSSRGCALGCIFCAPVERETFGTQYRWRSPDNICDELEHLAELGANAVYFIDDFFGFSPKRISALCERIIERGISLPWVAQVRAHGLSLEVLQLMRRAGCSTLCFGAESGTDRVLEILKKGVSVAQIREQALKIRQAGIQSVGYFIVGVPGETDDERSTTYDFIEEIAPDVVQLHIFNVFPGAPAMAEFGSMYSEAGTKFLGPTGRDDRLEALDEERRKFYLRYYLSPRYVVRTLRRRWRPLLANFGEEASFALRSTRFFLGGS